MDTVRQLTRSRTHQRMSENTNIGEVLVVCRRWTSESPKPETRFINLATNPSTSHGALELARQIERGHGHDFTIIRVDSERMLKGDWYVVNFLSPFLSNSWRELTVESASEDGRFTTMDRVAQVGPEGRRIRDAYVRSDLPTASGRRALWDHKTEVVQSMRVRTDVFIEPKAEKRNLADRYWNQRGRLLLAHRMRLHLARTAAVMLDTPVVGSRWTPCRPRDDAPESEMALCAWFNSSPGLLAMLGGRDNRVLQYPQFSLDTLRSMPAPNFVSLGEASREQLCAAFGELKDEVLLPLPQMDDDPVRRRLDDAVTEALGLDPEWVAQVRRALSEEPCVTNRRFHA